MMTVRKLVPITVAAMLAAQVASASLYSDATGDLNDGTVGDDLSGFIHLDILSVEILNDATDIMFKINLVGDPVATDWGKYMVAIDSVPAGDAASNGWGRPISMSSGMDYWIGSWVDSGNGAETYSWDGALWNLDNATYSPPSDIGVPIKDASSLTLTTTLASLGLGIGDTFTFDVFSSGGGGGDSAIDALSDPSASVTTWGGPYDSTSGLTYTVVPEPATFSLIAIGLGAMAIRRFRRK